MQVLKTFKFRFLYIIFGVFLSCMLIEGISQSSATRGGFGAKLSKADTVDTIHIAVNDEITFSSNENLKITVSNKSVQVNNIGAIITIIGREVGEAVIRLNGKILFKVNVVNRDALKGFVRRDILIDRQSSDRMKNIRWFSSDDSLATVKVVESDVKVNAKRIGEVVITRIYNMMFDKSPNNDKVKHGGGLFDLSEGKSKLDIDSSKLDGGKSGVAFSDECSDDIIPLQITERYNIKVDENEKSDNITNEDGLFDGWIVTFTKGNQTFVKPKKYDCACGTSVLGDLPRGEGIFGWIDKKTYQYVTKDTLVRENMDLVAVPVNDTVVHKGIAHSKNGIKFISVPRGSLPKSVLFKYNEVKNAKVLESIEKVVTPIGDVIVLDIMAWDAVFKQQVEPLVSVTINITDIDMQSYSVVHIKDDGSIVLIAENVTGDYTFLVDTFSVFAIIETGKVSFAVSNESCSSMEKWYKEKIEDNKNKKYDEVHSGEDRSKRQEKSKRNHLNKDGCLDDSYVKFNDVNKSHTHCVDYIYGKGENETHFRQFRMRNWRWLEQKWLLQSKRLKKYLEKVNMEEFFQKEVIEKLNMEATNPEKVDPEETKPKKRDLVGGAFEKY